MNCKNCKMTDEYCASGDCLHDKTNYDILKEYEAHKTPVPSYGEYEYIITENTSLKQIRDELDCAITQLREDKIDLEEENAQLKECVSKLKKMQYSYTPEEWNTMLRTVNRTKELLKECKPYVNNRFMETREHLNKPYTATDKVLHKKAEKLLTKIDEALK